MSILIAKPMQLFVDVGGILDQSILLLSSN